jgi:hypothetical protein
LEDIVVGRIDTSACSLRKETYFDDAVEDDTVVEALLCERVEVLTSLRRMVPVELQGDRSKTGVEEYSLLRHSEGDVCRKENPREK